MGELGVWIPVTSLAQGPERVGTAYDRPTVANGGGGPLRSYEAHSLAGTEESAVEPRQHGCWDQEQFWLVLSDIHRTNYASLVRLAALFLDGAGEDAVQDAFVQVSGQWDQIREADKVLLYLRRAVVNRAKSLLRHRLVVLRQPQASPLSAPASEDVALVRLADEALVRRVRRLPDRQRACIGLRFCLNLSERETAEVLGISTGSVKQHTSRALSKLGPALETYR
jgi:RNA polymerase sigma factor (sigma-70 family)